MIRLLKKFLGVVFGFGNDYIPPVKNGDNDEGKVFSEFSIPMGYAAPNGEVVEIQLCMFAFKRGKYYGFSYMNMNSSEKTWNQLIPVSRIVPLQNVYYPEVGFCVRRGKSKPRTQRRIVFGFAYNPNQGVMAMTWDARRHKIEAVPLDQPQTSTRR